MSNGSGRKGKDQKIPSRMIDLKATEVRPQQSASERSQSVPQASAARGAGPGKAGGPTGTASALAAASQTGQRAAASAAPKAATAANGGGRGTTGNGGKNGGGDDGRGPGDRGSGTPERVVIKERSGPGFFGTLTHLAAAVIGGGIVLYGANTIRDLGRQAGLEIPQPTTVVPESLNTRLATLEETVKSRPAASEVPASLETRIKALEDKAGRLEGVSSELAAIKAKQEELSKTATAKTTGDGETAVSAEVTEDLKQRLASVEQTLKTLSEAAGPDGNSGGRLAQLTALSARLTDLEKTLKTQMTSLRSNVLGEVDKRITPATEASKAAQSGTERIDREVSDLKTETARLQQRAENLKATLERLDKSIRAAKEETAKIASSVEGLRGDFDQEIKKVARPSDVAGAVKPLSEKVAGLEKGLKKVEAQEETRKQSGKQIVLALQLSNLKRTLDRGTAYGPELKAVKDLAGEGADFSALEKFKDSGVATVATLLKEFRQLSFDMIQADQGKKDGNWMDKLVSGAKSIVQVRRTGTTAKIDPNSTEGIVAKIEQELQAGRVAKAVEASKRLPAQAKKAAESWLSQLQARGAVDAAITKIEDDLKRALTSGKSDVEKG